MSFNYHHTHYTTSDGSQAMMVADLGTLLVLINEDGFSWTDPADMWRPIGDAPAGHACAECGTTEAQTYVVTQLDPEDDSTRTEVCRSCDDALRLADLLTELLVAEQATRPPFRTDDGTWDRDEEEADVVADVYREVAAKLAAATTLTITED